MKYNILDFCPKKCEMASLELTDKLNINSQDTILIICAELENINHKNLFCSVLGSLLKNKYDINALVFGDLKWKVYKNDIQKIINLTRATYNNVKVIFVTECYGSSSNIGSLVILNKGLNYTNNTLKLVGIDCTSVLAYTKPYPSALQPFPILMPKQLIKMASFGAEFIANGLKSV